MADVSHQRGADVALSYARSRVEAEEAADRVRAAGRRAAVIAANLADPLAKVLQARMWLRQEELMRGGMPVTDAREQAEREHLMLLV